MVYNDYIRITYHVCGEKDVMQGFAVSWLEPERSDRILDVIAEHIRKRAGNKGVERLMIAWYRRKTIRHARIHAWRANRLST